MLNPAHGIGQGQDFDDDFSRAWVVAEPPNEMPPDAYVIDAEGRMSLTVQVPRATDGDLEVKQEHLDQAARSLGKFLHLQLPDLITYIYSKVSDKMQDSAAPLIARGIWAAASGPIKSIMIVAVQANGRMVMSIAALVSRPPTNLW